MLTIEKIREELKVRNVSEVARQIGMRRQQLWLIASGINKNPTYETLKRISDYLVETGNDSAS